MWYNSFQNIILMTCFFNFANQSSIRFQLGNYILENKLFIDYIPVSFNYKKCFTFFIPVPNIYEASYVRLNHLCCK